MGVIVFTNRHLEKDNVRQIEVGDYVEYKPDVTKRWATKYFTGYRKSQEFETDINAKWRVLFIDKENDKVYITTEGTVNEGLILKGIVGYQAGPFVLDDICKNLYSQSSTNIIARSMTVEDLNRAYGFTPPEPKKFVIYKIRRRYGNEYRYIKNKHKFSKFYMADNGGKSKKDKNGIEYSVITKNESVFMTETWYFYYLEGVIAEILGEKYGWLASRCVDLNSLGCRMEFSSGVSYDIRCANGECVISNVLHYSFGRSFKTCSNGIRPVICINSKFLEFNEESRENKYKSWKIVV